MIGKASDLMSDANWTRYYEAVIRSPSLMGEIEEALNQLRGASRFALSDALHELPGGFTPDQVRMALSALVSVGTLVSSDQSYFAVSPLELDSGRDKRESARAAIGWVRDNSEPPGDLLVSAPAEAKRQTPIPFEREFLDLRTAVRSLVAGARESLILASPYWDLDVATDLAGLVGKRLEAGVDIRVLARPARSGSETDRALSLIANALSSAAGSSVRFLEEPSELDRFGTATFHFKLAIADREIAYLGSANFNTAGLASRWELGILLRGRQARTLAALADSLFEAARPAEY